MPSSLSEDTPSTAISPACSISAATCSIQLSPGCAKIVTARAAGLGAWVDGTHVGREKAHTSHGFVHRGNSDTSQAERRFSRPHV